MFTVVKKSTRKEILCSFLSLSLCKANLSREYKSVNQLRFYAEINRDVKGDNVSD